MNRLNVGDIVRTSYGTGPYEVTHIERDCDCPSFMDSLTYLNEAPKSPRHTHLTCKKVGERHRDPYYLNGYEEETLLSVWNPDFLILEKEDILLILNLLL